MQASIGYINVAVTDVDRATAFYRDVLGFAVEFSDAEFGYTSFDANGMRFAIARAIEGHPVGGHTGIGIRVDDVDAAHAEMKAKGTSFVMEPQSQPWGGYMAMFEDPDGNVFYLDAYE